MDFEGAKNIQVVILGICRHCKFLIGIWHLDLDLDILLVFDPLMIQLLALSWF